MSLIPLFKSHYSIGKSILSFEEKGENPHRSIIDLCLENNISKPVVVEDTVHGLKYSYQACKDNDLIMRFGWRVDCVNSEEELEELSHKVIIFIKNNQGWFDLLKIYNKANTIYKTKNKAKVTLKLLKDYWTKNLDLVIPHYDNFIFYNLTQENKFVVDFGKIEPKFLWEDNNHIFDNFIKENTEKYCLKYSKEMVKVKSVYYNKKKDFPAWQIMKISTNRKYGRVPQSLNMPSLDFCCSNEFCMESYLKK